MRTSRPTACPEERPFGCSGPAVNLYDRVRRLLSAAQLHVTFANAITNQPVCSPSRACLFTGTYATRHGVWRNGIPLDPESVTLAKLFRSAGYTANYVGKWHLAPESHQDPATLGPVPKQYRGGFDDFWEGCNVIELTSHPYEGSIWDSEGKEIHFKDIYRVDFITERVVRFLRQPPARAFSAGDLVPLASLPERL